VENGTWNKPEFPLELDLKNICSLINIKSTFYIWTTSSGVSSFF